MNINPNDNSNIVNKMTKAVNSVKIPSNQKIVLFCDLKTRHENIPLFEKNILFKVLKKVEKNPNIFSKN